MKKVFAIAVIAFLFVSFHVAYLIVEKKDGRIKDRQNVKAYSSEINGGIELFTPERMADLRVDEYFLLKKVEEKKALQNIKLSSLRNQFSDDPFKRLAYKNDIVSDIEIERKDTMNAIGKNFDGNFYSVKNTGGSFGSWNDILVKALYCDIEGYDNQDFFILKLMHKKDGGYLDTHFLLALLMLKENGCWEEKKINEQISLVAEDIINAEKKDKDFSDLYAERIVFLYWAGFGKSIKNDWIELIITNFNKEAGWLDEKKNGFSVHVTGLSLLSLMYYLEGEHKQNLY